MVMEFGFIGTMLGAFLYGGSAGDGWKSVGQGAIGGAILGLAFGVFAVLRGG